MEPNVSLLCSKKLSTDSHPERNDSSPHPPFYSYESHFNNIPPSKLSPPMKFSDRSFMCVSHISHMCYMSLPSHPPWLVDDEYKLWISSPPATFFVLDPNILLKTLHSKQNGVENSVAEPSNTWRDLVETTGVLLDVIVSRNVSS